MGTLTGPGSRARGTARAALVALICSFAGLGTTGVAGQETVRLDVRVVATEGPLDAATVVVARQSLRTDATGLASFRVAPGAHRLRVSAFAHTPLERVVTVRADTLLEIRLEPEALEDEAIVVTSTRGERRIDDTPIRVEVLVQEEVEEKLLMTPGCIVMLLNETTGLRVQETAPSLGGANIRIQGLRGRYTQLLADGLPLYGGQAGALGLLQIPPLDLRQVEVIKGAASALYGGSALGGVVNLISKRPANEREVLLNATTRAGADALIWLSEKGEQWGWTLLAGLHGQRRADVDGDDWTDIPSHRRLTLRPRLFFEDPRTRTMATAGVMVEDRRGGGSLLGGTSYAQELQTTRADGGLTVQRFLRNALLFDLRASAVATLHEHRFGDRRERDRHSTVAAEASLRGDAGRHHWAAGLAVQVDGYHADDIDGFDFGYWTPAVFAQDELAVSERVTLALSARLDRHSRYGTFLSPRASVLARPLPELALRISAGTGFFAATPFTEETEEVGLGNVAPLDELEAERARSLAVDVSTGLGGVEAVFTVFASRIEDAVGVRASDDGSLARLINVAGSTRTRGTEVLLRYRGEPWSLTISHTYLDAREPAPDGNGRRRVPLTPRHMAGLVAVYEEHGSGRAGLELYYTGEQSTDDNPYRTMTEPYVIIGLLVEKRWGRVRAFLNLENITDRRQTRFDPIRLPAPGPFGRQTTDSWAPLEGRVFNGGVRIAF